MVNLVTTKCRNIQKTYNLGKIDEITENKYDVIQEIIRDKQLLQIEYGPASNKKEIIEDIIR